LYAKLRKIFGIFVDKNLPQIYGVLEYATLC